MSNNRLRSLCMHSLWLLPFVSFLCGYQLLSWIYGNDGIETPALVGKPLQEAFALLSTTNLNPRLVAQKEEADLPAGTILSQTPQPHTKIKANQSVFLVASIKPAIIKAPALVHKSIQEVKSETENKGIRIKTYSLDSTLPKELCIGQWPREGTPLQERVMITYNASGNQKPVILPNFKNKPVQSVVEFLNNHHIKTTITPNNDHTCSATCMVIDQRPLAGSVITLDKPLTVQLHVHHT